MKKYNIWTFILMFFVVLNSSCEENKDMLMYDTENGNYIYFAPPFKVDQFENITTERQDSMVFSFGFSELGTTEYTFRVPIQIAGMASDKDREYRFEVVEEETTATLHVEYEPITTTHTLKIGEISDTAEVKILLTEVLKKESRRIKLRMIPTNDFMVGASEHADIILSFTNMLTEPNWWKYWTNYMGPFCQEKYQKWINLYPIPEPGRAFDMSYVNDKVVYWDNMPTSVVTSWYPVTMTKVTEMKKFFENNIVYIDGDPANGRVLLP